METTIPLKRKNAHKKQERKEKQIARQGIDLSIKIASLRGMMSLLMPYGQRIVMKHFVCGCNCPMENETMGITIPL